MSEFAAKLSGKVIVVTGGVSGFGRAIVDQLMALNAIVAVLDNDGEGLKAMIDDQGCSHGETCDVSDPEAVETAVEALFARTDRFDGLVNNVGIIRSAPLVDMRNLGDPESRRKTQALWRQVIDTNLSSAFYVTTNVVEKMIAKRTGGTIVNIGSVAGRGNAGQSAYAAAKAGLEALSASWARELGPMGIRAVTVAPGYCDTPSTHDALSETHIAKVRGEIPLRRLGTAEEVADAVVFALSNPYFSGRTLNLDGGLPA